MSRAGQVSVEEQIQQETIVDCDFHLHVPTEKLYDYVDEPTIRKTLEEFGPPPAPISYSSKYGHDYDDYNISDYMRPQGIAIDADEVREVSDDMGVDTVIVDPGTHLPMQGRARYPSIQNAIARAYNDYVLDEVIDVDRGIYATIAIPRDPDVAVEEIDRMGSEKGFVGAQGWLNHNRLWGVPEYDPIYEKLTEYDLPLALHISATDNRFTLSSDSMRSIKELVISDVAYTLTANVMNMILTGVFDKFPSLTVIMQEAGVGWIPYLAHRADDLYQTGAEDLKLSERMLEEDRRYLEKMPSEYIFENMFVSTQPMSLPSYVDDAEAMLKVCHASEMFIFSTDWPHSTVDAPNWMFDNAAIDDELRARISRENAEEAYRL